MLKNVAGQSWLAFAFIRSTGEPVTDDAAAITAHLCKDGGSPVLLTTDNPTWIRDGYYRFSLTQAETNADKLELFCESTTPGVAVVAVEVEKFPGIVAAIATAVGVNVRTAAYNLAIDRTFLESGVLTLIQRDDYNSADGRAHEMLIERPGVDFTSATVVAGAGTEPGVPVIAPTVSLINKTVGSCTLRIEFTSASLDEDPGMYQWDAHIVVSGRRNTVVGGQIILNPKYADAPA